jgi:hypothetical protein
VAAASGEAAPIAADQAGLPPSEAGPVAIAPASDIAGTGVQTAVASEAASNEAAVAAAPGGDVAGISAANPPHSEQVAGVQARGPDATIAGLLPTTGEPVLLFGLGMLGVVGLGLALRRVHR